MKAMPSILVAALAIASVFSPTAASAQGAPAVARVMSTSSCPMAVAPASSAPAAGVLPTTFSECGYFEGGRVTYPGWESCRSKYGTWRWDTCRHTYVYSGTYVVWKTGSPRPASCA